MIILFKMRKNFLPFFAIFVAMAVVITSCGESDEPIAPEKIVVEQNYVPYRTEKYLRIGYMLKTWEFLKEGLTLQRIIIVDNNTKADLYTIEKESLPIIHKDPLGEGFDKIDRYYLSIQLPIPLTQAVPLSISHRFILRDTIQNKDVSVEGGTFQPRYDESPHVIAAPVKGDYYLVHNQSTMDYHFWIAFFIGGSIYTNEKFAFDLIQMDETWTQTFSGDPQVNESYFAYGDTLYSVASGTVLKAVDGLPENAGDSHDIPLNTLDASAGNHLLIDIGGGCYAVYMHCMPGSLLVNAGDVVTEGQPLAQLGNSGNSTEPHLHFHLVDRPELWYCDGLPFVFKNYTKTGEIVFNPNPAVTPIAPIIGVNANLENWSITSFE